MIQVLFFSLTKAQFESLGRLIAVLLGSTVSPTWFLLKHALHPFLDLDLLLQKDIGITTFLHMISQLQSFGPQALLYQLIPAIILCGVASICYLVLCSFVGKYTARLVLNRLTVTA